MKQTTAINKMLRLVSMEIENKHKKLKDNEIINESITTLVYVKQMLQQHLQIEKQQITEAFLSNENIGEEAYYEETFGKSST